MILLHFATILPNAVILCEGELITLFCFFPGANVSHNFWKLRQLRNCKGRQGGRQPRLQVSRAIIVLIAHSRASSPGPHTQPRHTDRRLHWCPAQPLLSGSVLQHSTTKRYMTPQKPLIFLKLENSRRELFCITYSFLSVQPLLCLDIYIYSYSHTSR